MAYDPYTPSTPNKLISLATTNATSVVNHACVLTFLALGNVGTSNCAFVKIYDKGSAPTVGTDVPVQTYPVPGNVSGAGSNLMPPGGMQMLNGFAFAITGAMADSDTTAVAIGQVVVNYGTR